MKTIDKVVVVSASWAYHLYEKNVRNKNAMETSDFEMGSDLNFENQMKQMRFIYDEESEKYIGYNIDKLFGEKTESYVKELENYRESDEVKISSYFDSNYRNNVTIYWHEVYDEIKQHEELTDTYFMPIDVEKLASGEIKYSEFTDKVVNEVAIGCLYCIMDGLKSDLEALTADNLEWE